MRKLLINRNLKVFSKIFNITNIKELYENHYCNPETNTIMFMNNEDSSICIKCFEIKNYI